MDICVSGCLDVMVSTVQRPPFFKGGGVEEIGKMALKGVEKV